MDSFSKLTKLRSLFRFARWARFLAYWLFTLLLVAVLYFQLIEPAIKVNPELGFCYRYPFGNALLSQSTSHDGLRLVFAPAPKGSKVGGGLIIGSSLSVAGRVIPALRSLIPAFRPFKPPGSTQKLNIELAGDTGTEKLELKVRNDQGESAVLLGTDQYPISTDLRTISIALSELRGSEHAVMGAYFDPIYGIDAFILGLGDHLDTKALTSVRVSRIWLSEEQRSDIAIVGALLLTVFILTVCRRTVILWHYDFSVFISYAHPSAPYEEYRLPEDHPASVLCRELGKMHILAWIDRDGILASDEYCPLIAEQIRRNRYLIVIGDESSINSQFVGIELGLRFHRKNASWVVEMFNRWSRRRRFSSLDIKDIVVVQKVDLPHVQQMLLPYQYITAPKDGSMKRVAKEIAALIYWGAKPATAYKKKGEASG